MKLTHPLSLLALAASLSCTGPVRLAQAQTPGTPPPNPGMSAAQTEAGEPQANTSAQAEAGEPRADSSAPAPGAGARVEGAGASGVTAAPDGRIATHRQGGAEGHASEGNPSARDGKEGKKPGAADRLELGTATVTGDREQPKVMYIVPWKKSDIGDLSGKPMNSLLDEALAPVDREVFKREVIYYNVVKADASQNGASKPPAQGEK